MKTLILTYKRNYNRVANLFRLTLYGFRLILDIFILIYLIYIYLDVIIYKLLEFLYLNHLN